MRAATDDLGPQGRMLVVLLAATDPLGLVAGGRSPTLYSRVARAAVEELRAGGGLDELILSLRVAGYRVQEAAAFARAATDWWRNGGRGRRSFVPSG